MKKSVDEIEIGDVMDKPGKKQIYQEWTEKSGKRHNFKPGVWSKCYAINRNDPASEYIKAANRKGPHEHIIRDIT